MKKLEMVIAWLSLEYAFSDETDEQYEEVEQMTDAIDELIEDGIVEQYSDDCGLGIIHEGKKYYRSYAFPED